MELEFEKWKENRAARTCSVHISELRVGLSLKPKILKDIIRMTISISDLSHQFHPSFPRDHGLMSRSFRIFLYSRALVNWIFKAEENGFNPLRVLDTCGVRIGKSFISAARNKQSIAQLADNPQISASYPLLSITTYKITYRGCKL